MFSLKGLCLLAVLAVAFMLYRYDPAGREWAPKCVFRMLTGYNCPGCGFQRCMHSLLHGRVVEAVGYNLFLVVAVPYLLLLMAEEWLLSGETRERWARVLTSRGVVLSYVVLFFLWFLVRNLLGI
ncbi:MAG: DUF2752 domain-containing protein [Prevotella sp.]|nr:DUF2752 domain-containing protein [Prevotella sp.]